MFNIIYLFFIIIYQEFLLLLSLSSSILNTHMNISIFKIIHFYLFNCVQYLMNSRVKPSNNIIIPIEINRSYWECDYSIHNAPSLESLYQHGHRMTATVIVIVPGQLKGHCKNSSANGSVGWPPAPWMNWDWLDERDFDSSLG